MVSLRSRSLSIETLQLSPSTDLLLSGLPSWFLEVSSLKRFRHDTGLHSWINKCSGTCRGAEYCALARRADWLVSDVQGFRFGLWPCTISRVSSVLDWKLCLSPPNSAISDLCTLYSRCSSCTCCLKTSSCSMIVLRSDSLLSCLEYLSIGSTKMPFKSFRPLAFSNILASFWTEPSLSSSLMMVMPSFSNKAKRILLVPNKPVSIPENRRLMLQLLLISHLHSPLVITHEHWESPYISKSTERDSASVNLSSAPITHFRAVDSAQTSGEFWGRQSWSLDVAARLSLMLMKRTASFCRKNNSQANQKER